MKYVVCYSGGHSSAITAVETVRRYGKENTILLNHDLNERSEDADIKRFKNEVADYLDIPITYANMPNWEQMDQFDVCIEENAFKYGVQSSAICTRKLKTEPFKKWLAANYPVKKGSVSDDITVMYGFDKNETVRITRRVGIMISMGYRTDYPLLWDHRTIFNIEDVGIKRPITYDIFKHANCKGCLKSGKQHWFIVFCLYPDVWNKAKKAEQAIGHSILREKYLTEYEREFEYLKGKLQPTELISPQKFWTSARKLIAEDDILPCECSY